MDQSYIGQRLKTLRKEKGLTQEQLGERLGVSSRSVSRWENGVNLPDFDLLLELCRLYGVSLDELLKGEKRTVSEETEQALTLAAEYTSEQQRRLIRRLHILAWIGVIGWIVFLAVYLLGLDQIGWAENLASFAAGLAFSEAVILLFFTGAQGQRLFHRRYNRKEKDSK